MASTKDMLSSHYNQQTRSSAITEGLCDALRQTKSCKLLHCCMKNQIWKGLQFCSNWITLKVTQGHRNCHNSTGHI